jgi:hypothetical protein
MNGSLFFAQAAPDVSKDRLRAAFEKFGAITGLEFIKRQSASSESAPETSSGCGYVAFKDPEAAAAAFKSLHGTKELAAPGLVLVCAPALSTPKAPSTSTVPLSDDAQPETRVVQSPSVIKVQDGLALDSPCSITSYVLLSTSDDDKCSRSVFFARVPPAVPVETIQQLFSTCGEVLGINLFKPWATSKLSKVRELAALCFTGMLYHSDFT